MARFAEVPLAEVRDYWDARPCNVRHSPAPVGTREFFEQVEGRKYLVEPHIPTFAEFPRWAGKRVLEIGCGIGTDTVNFARAGATVTAVDLSTESLELARKHVDVFGLGDRVRFLQANAEQLSDDVQIEPYDLVYSFGVLHHTPHPERAFDQLRNFVAPGSVVKVMVYHRWSWKVMAIVVGEGQCRFWRADELVARSSEAQTGCPVTYTYSRRSGRELLTGIGLEVDRIEVDHIFPYRVPEYVQYRYEQAYPFRAMPQPLFAWLERRFGWHLCLTAHAPRRTR